MKCIPVSSGKITDDSYDWFYGTKRNLFWPILQEVYGINLQTKQEKQELFSHRVQKVTRYKELLPQLI